MIIEYRTNFVLHKERRGDYSIHVRVTFRGERPIDASTGCRIPARDLWDAGRRRVVANFRDAQAHNLRISSVQEAVDTIMARFSLVEKRVPSRGEVASGLAEHLGRSNSGKGNGATLSDTMDRFTRSCGMMNQWTGSTYTKFRTLKRRMLEYGGDVRMDDIGEEWLSGFLNHIIRVNGVRNTTAAKTMSFVRWMLRWAADNGLYGGNAHTAYRPRLKGARFEQKEVIYLTIEELREVEEHDFGPAGVALSHVRDVFVFCCYTGLRFSDAAKLRRQDIRDGYIEVVTKKTDERLRIELNAHSRAILDRYRDEEWLGDMALPAVSNQKTNRRLKEIGKACGMDTPVRLVWFSGGDRHEEVVPKHELLTTHVARRTFVVTALQLGIPVEVIIRWTGHSDYKSMRPYVAIVDELKARNMSKFDTI